MSPRSCCAPTHWDTGAVGTGGLLFCILARDTTLHGTKPQTFRAEPRPQHPKLPSKGFCIFPFLPGRSASAGASPGLASELLSASQKRVRKETPPLKNKMSGVNLLILLTRGLCWSRPRANGGPGSRLATGHGAACGWREKKGSFLVGERFIVGLKVAPPLFQILVSGENNSLDTGLIRSWLICYSWPRKLPEDFQTTSLGACAAGGSGQEMPSRWQPHAGVPRACPAYDVCGVDSTGHPPYAIQGWWHYPVCHRQGWQRRRGQC